MHVSFKLLLAGVLCLGCSTSTGELTPYAEREPILPVRQIDDEPDDTLPGPLDTVNEEQDVSDPVMELPEPENEQLRLPMPWASSEFEVVSESLTRVVSVDENVVGFVKLDGETVIAGTRAGGLFLSGPGLPWVAMPSNLPALSSFHGDASTWIACPLDGGEALVSLDGGLGWAHLAVGCSSTGAEGVHYGDGQLYVFLPDGSLRIGPLGHGASRTVFVPLSQPRIVTASDSNVVVLGDNSVAWSDDGGHHFSLGQWPAELPLTEIRRAQFGDKGLVVAVGRAERGAHGLVISRDYGQTWSVPSNLPRGTHDMAGIAVTWDGDVVISPMHSDGQALLSMDGARTWVEPEIDWPLAGPAMAATDGFVVASPRGMALGLQHQSMVAPAVLESTLRSVVFTHPRIAVAAGMAGGLYRTVNGGETWRPVAASMGTRFVDVASSGGHTVYALGASLMWKSTDAGIHWEPTELGTHCDGRWIRFHGDIGLMGCGVNGVFISRNAGESWSQTHGDDAIVGPVHSLMSDGVFVGLSDDGHHLLTLDIEDARWSRARLPHGIQGTELRTEDSGLSLLTADGEIARITELEAPWFWRTGLAAAHGRDWKLHVPLPSGVVLLADETGVYRIGGDGVLSFLGAALAPNALILKGDGGLMVLGQSATIVFNPN